MNGQSAQVVALVSHGNAWLHGVPGVPVPDRAHPSFRYVRSVALRRRDRPGRRQRTVVGWLRSLARDGARRLLAMAADAWIFGGMGSWNDLGFEGPDQGHHEAVTATLYAAALRGVAAANAFDPAVAP